MAATHACYHCGLPAPERDDLRHELAGEPRIFCCHGCLAVALTITAGGLDAYYRLREAPGTAASDAPQRDYSIYDQAEFQQDFVESEGSHRQAALAIDGITCAACAWLIEHHLQRVDGINSASVNLARHRALVEWDPAQIALSAIFQAIADIGYLATPWQDNQEEQRLHRENRDYLMRLGVAGIGMMQVGMYAIAYHRRHGPCCSARFH